MPDGYINMTPTTADQASDAALVARWRAEVRILEEHHAVSYAAAAEQRELERHLGRQLTQDEVDETHRAAALKVLPERPLSAQARFARGD